MKSSIKFRWRTFQSVVEFSIWYWNQSSGSVWIWNLKFDMKFELLELETEIPFCFDFGVGNWSLILFVKL